MSPELEQIKKTRPLDYHDEAHLKMRQMYARNAQMDRFVSTFEACVVCAVWIAVIGLVSWMLWKWVAP